MKLSSFLTEWNIKTMRIVNKTTHKIYNNNYLWGNLILKDFNVNVYNSNIRHLYDLENLRKEYNMFNRHEVYQCIFLPGISNNLLKYGKYYRTVCDLPSYIKNDDMKHIPNTTFLNLSGNKNITTEGLKYLHNLDHLILTDNYMVKDEDLKYLQNLTTLDIDSNNIITFEGIKNNLPNLKLLILGKNNTDVLEGKLNLLPMSIQTEFCWY